MPTGATSTSVANQAILLIGDNQPLVTGVSPTFDSSTAGIALSQIYVPTVQEMQRQFSWDASRRTVALTASGNAAPYPFGYTGEYIYPANGIEVWEIQPRVPADLNDPLPSQWSVGNTLVNGVQTKVIWTSQTAPYATYNNNPSESTWDAGFLEAVVRALAAKLAIAIAGKPDTGMFMAQASAAAAAQNKGRDA